MLCVIPSSTLSSYDGVVVVYQELLVGVYQRVMYSIIVLPYLDCIFHKFHGVLLIWVSRYVLK